MKLVRLFLAPFFIVAGILVSITTMWVLKTGEPLSHIIPYTLLFTGFRAQTKAMWVQFGQQMPLIEQKHEPIPEIESQDYSFDKFRELTKNFTIPALVRGHFIDTPACKNFGTKGYLNKYLGKFEIPVIRGARHYAPQTNRSVQSIGSTLDEIMDGDKEKSYLFFPMKSRRDEANANRISADFDGLSAACNDLGFNDLQMDKKIWNGFGHHSAFRGVQFIMGCGTNDTEETTGTGWHCAAGSNFFVQIVGRKRWYFMHPEQSWYFHPLRNGVLAFMTSMKSSQGAHHKYLPLRYADLNAGDMLYNPAFQWHTIKNYEGLSIGAPIREFNISQSIQSNFYFMSIVLWNTYMEKLGIQIGGFSNEPGAKQFD